MTRRDGIYGIGDVCSYPGKLKLILTGFSEAANASHHCYKEYFQKKHCILNIQLAKELISFQTNIYIHRF